MYETFKTGVSQPRLEAYRQSGFDDWEVLTECLWNTALAESFYPSLQYLEVGLRNSMHNALTFCNRTPHWFKSAFMCDRCGEDVETAEVELKKRGKDHNDPNRMVAELGFGFWVRLFNKHYQQSLWNNKTFLLRAFPNATNTERSRQGFSVRMDEIRRFRNRVFHHERIIGLNVRKFHDEINETIGWISSDLLNATKMVDRFPEVYRKEFREELKARLPKPGTQV